MTETVAMGTIIVGAAVFILAGVAKLYGRSRDGMLLSYSFYLISWYGLVLFMMVFFLSPELLPRQSHYGYLLFSSIFIVPMHGAISYFFADVCLSLVGRTMRRSLKMILVAPFIVILVVYAIDILKRLSIEEVPEHFVLSSPFSLNLMLAVVGGSLLFLAFNSRKAGKEVRKAAGRFALFIAGGAALGFLFGLNVMPWPDSTYQSNIAIAVLALLNIPGYYCVGRIVDIRARQTTARLESADLGSFAGRYTISPRELEVVSLVIAGRSNREIEAELFISAETVKKHVYNIYKKVGVRNRVQLVNAVLASDGRPETEA